MKKILISWIGKHDLTASQSGDLGPVLAAIIDSMEKGNPYNRVHLLCNYSQEQSTQYMEWLLSMVGKNLEITSTQVSLSSPTAYAEIYPKILSELGKLAQECPDFQRYVHLSPGTPAMTAVWVLLVKTHFPSVCVESWLDRDKIQQVRHIELPFEIAAEFSQGAIRKAGRRLISVESSSPSLSGITGQSEPMLIAKSRAERMGIREVPVLILGETGTGKEVFARAIHESSPRKKSPFVAVNCGALPEDLAESLLFGHKKGAFTGAYQDHEGYFSAADGGTLFLDEIGELSPLLQTKLLRVLQEKEYTRLGDNKVVRSDFRLVAATHRDLTHMISQGKFREDLFYRIAIGILKLPPIRDRSGDIILLSEAMMSEINTELADQPEFQKKRLSVDALQFIARQNWPGNIRELRASILRAAIWSDGVIITASDIESSIISRTTSSGLLPSVLGKEIDLGNEIGLVVSHYITLALKETQGNKLAAAKKLGLKSSQVLDNWIKKYSGSAQE
ncbi:sigma-54 interaction domain-containing protein [Endozoicomonas ascidiicola]|uniref:sigma-54 interaction domain-containing protein n=1 Tax=Endozoicomonas ascidiicola TaxID=1698521 RepID=UPI0008311082|nr:sigma 54-interacting transcriptional regulator [Endozoicomonas ascidiicola]